MTSTFHLTHDLDLGFSRTNFEIATCDFELRITYNAHDFALGFSRSNFEEALSGMGGSTWSERDVNQSCWAQYIVSGAYSMRSHLSSVCLSVNLFSNQIGSLSFCPIFPIFGLNVHNNIAKKRCGSRILIFASNFL